MEKVPKSFALYCSHGASRVLKFYSHQGNALNYKPAVVIYDGSEVNVINSLRIYFPDNLCIFDKNILTDDEKEKIHSTTSKFIHEILLSNNIDYLLCFGDKILKKDLINDYPRRLINFHPSILPAFKGLKAIDQALANKVAFLGNTAHYINEGIDTGDIIIQTAMLREDFDVYEDVLELQFPMIKTILRDLLGYKVLSSEMFSEIQKREKKFLIPTRCN